MTTRRTVKKKRNGQADGEDDETPQGDHSNEAAGDCLTKVEGWLDEIEKYKSAYMNKAKRARVEISGIYANAKDLGVDTRAVKALIKTRQLDKSKEKVIQDLDLDHLSSYRSYAASWDSTPLAQAVPAEEEAHQ